MESNERASRLKAILKVLGGFCSSWAYLPSGVHKQAEPSKCLKNMQPLSSLGSIFYFLSASRSILFPLRPRLQPQILGSKKQRFNTRVSSMDLEPSGPGNTLGIGMGRGSETVEICSNHIYTLLLLLRLELPVPMWNLIVHSPEMRDNERHAKLYVERETLKSPLLLSLVVWDRTWTSCARLGINLGESIFGAASTMM